ncbi:hypothetical protein GCM10027296_15680 [Chitinimonas naiadis]
MQMLHQQLFQGLGREQAVVNGRHAQDMLATGLRKLHHQLAVAFQRDGLGSAWHCALAGWRKGLLPDEETLPGPRFDQAKVFQDVEGMSHRGGADLMQCTQLPHRRDAVTGMEYAGADALGQIIGKLLVAGYRRCHGRQGRVSGT